MANSVRIAASLDDKVSGPLDRIKGKFDTLGKSQAGASYLGNLGARGTEKIIQGVGDAIERVAGVIGDSIKAGSDLNETLQKSGVVFGTSAGVVEDFGNHAAESLGLTKTAAIEAAATFGNLFVGLNLGQPAAAAMSTKLVALAGDLASFNNLDPNLALEKLRSGLAGESEPLRSLGVFLTEAKVKAEAMALGLVKGNDTLSEGAKVQARYSLILKETKTAQGDFARSTGTLAQEQRVLAAKVGDLSAKFGQALVPIMAKVAGVAVQVVDGFVSMVTNGSLLQPILIGLGVAALALAAPFIAAAAPFIALAAAVAGVVFVLDQLGLLQPIVAEFGKSFGAIMKSLGDVFAEVGKSFQAVVGGIIGAVRNVMDIAAQIPGPWQDGAKAVSATLSGMQKDVESWGKTTAATAGAAGGVTAGGFATSLAAGAPEVAAAAATGLADPPVAAVEKAAWKVKQVAQKLPGDIAKALLAGRSDWTSAWKTFTDDTDKHMTRAVEIASIKAKLAGKAIAEGLASTDPDRRTATAAIVLQLKARLGELSTVSAKAGNKAGDDIAAALRKTAPKSKAAAALMALQVKNSLGQLPSAAYGWGTATGRNFANDLGNTATAAGKAAARVAKAVWRALHVASPAEEGPLSEDGGPGRWGEKVALSFAGGMAKRMPKVGPMLGAVPTFAGASSYGNTGNFTATMVAPRGIHQPTSGTGDVHFHYSPTASTASPNEARDFVASILPEFMREAKRQGAI